MKISFKTLIPWIALFLLILGVGVWYFITNRVTESENANYNSIIQEANTWYQGKEYSTAMDKYYEAADLIPSRYEAFEGVVKILLDKNRVDDALALIDNSAKKVASVDQAKLYAMIGEAYYSQNNFDKSLESCKRGVALDGNNQDAELLLGKSYLKLGKVDEATAALDLTNIYTGDDESEVILLLAYIKSTSNPEESKTILSSITPTDKWKTYYEDFSSILSSLTDDTKFNSTKLGRVYVNAGYPYLSISVLEPIEDQIVEYVDGLYFLGRAYLDYGDYSKAIAEFEKAVTLGGLEDSIYWGEARAQYLNKDLDTAITDYSKALANQGKKPSQTLVTEYLDILINNNQTLKASEVLQNVTVNIKEPYIYLYGVEISYSNNSMEKVKYYLSLLSKMSLSGDDLKNYLYWDAKYMLDTNSDTSAISDVLSHLLAQDRYNPKYYLLLGKLNIVVGNSTEAANAFKKTIEYDLTGSVTNDATNLLSTVD